MTARRTQGPHSPHMASGLAGPSLAALAVCCGLPVLLAAGSGVAVLGVGLRSWVLIMAGLLASTAGWLLLAEQAPQVRCPLSR